MDLKQQIEILFEQLSRPTLPSMGSFSDVLSVETDKARITRHSASYIIPINRQITTMFATAAVEVWQRSIHSFLISSALTNISEIWSSVNGYYSSHFSMRAFAHLIGYHQLYRKKRIVQLDIVKGRFYGKVINKREKEHQFYWKVVKNNSHFTNDVFFTNNDENIDTSDCSHRNYANYSDHVGKFQLFKPLDKCQLKDRIKYLSEMELSSVPIPDRTNYPDVASVQIVAYHRIIKFRQLLDEILNNKNRFWNLHRDPEWCRDFMDFQVVKPKFLEMYS